MSEQESPYIHHPGREWICVRCGTKVKAVVTNFDLPGTRWDCLVGSPVVCFRCQFVAFTGLLVPWIPEVGEKLDISGEAETKSALPSPSPAQSSPGTT